MDWFGSDVWVTWIALGVVLLGVELFSGALIFLMLGVAGLSAAVAAVTGAPDAAQIAVFGSVSVALLTFVRPRIAQRIHNGPTIAVGAHRLVGQTALVVEDISHEAGRVRIGDQLWSARPIRPDDTFPGGDQVVIVSIEGATAIVDRKEVD